MPPRPMTLAGQRFMKRLEVLGLSVRAALELEGVQMTRANVSRACRAPDPQLSSLQLLARLARCSVSYLIGETDSPEPLTPQPPVPKARPRARPGRAKASGKPGKPPAAKTVPEPAVEPAQEPGENAKERYDLYPENDLRLAPLRLAERLPEDSESGRMIRVWAARCAEHEASKPGRPSLRVRPYHWYGLPLDRPLKEKERKLFRKTYREAVLLLRPGLRRGARGRPAK